MTKPAPAPQKRGVSHGCNHPKWLSRNVINKQFGELAGYPLYKSFWLSVYWLGEQIPDDTVGAK